MSRDIDLPRVSCVIPVHNGEAYLREALDSLFAQNYPNLEIVVVNDGSTDGTANVIDRFGDRVRVLTQTNRGVSVARNRGVEMSSGQLLCFLDADDLLDSRKLMMQAEQFRADPELDLCNCYATNFWSPELSAETRERDCRSAEPHWWQKFAYHISTWLFRRELWDRVGGFSPQLRYAEDLDWLSRARDLPMRSLTLEEVLAHRRLHPNNSTARSRDEQAISMAKMLKSHLMRAKTRIHIDQTAG